MLLLLLLLPVCLALVLALLMDISWLSCPTRCILVGQGNSVMRFLVLKSSVSLLYGALPFFVCKLLSQLLLLQLAV